MPIYNTKASRPAVRTQRPQAGVGRNAMGVDDVARMVDERTAGVADAAARATYIGTKMMDIPEAYRNQLPTTADNNALGTAEQKIREQYRKDMGVHVEYQVGYHGVAGHTTARGPAADTPQGTMGRLQAEADRRFAAGDGDAGQPAVRAAEKPPENLDNMTTVQLIAMGLAGGTAAASPAAGATGPARAVQTAPSPAVDLRSANLSAASLIAMGLRGR